MSTDRTRYAIEDISAQHTSVNDAVHHAIESLERLLAKPRFTIGKGESRQYLELRRDMPYVIHETSLTDTHILVNRNYKPLGSNSRAHENYVKYEEYQAGHLRLSNEKIATVTSPGRERGLFGDENPPWRGRKEAKEYLARLKRLYELLSDPTTNAA